MCGAGAGEGGPKKIVRISIFGGRYSEMACLLSESKEKNLFCVSYAEGDRQTDQFLPETIPALSYILIYNNLL